MKKLLILPYFGSFNNYFELWLESCRANSDIDWLIITDNNMTSYNVPGNVTIINTTFEMLRKEVQKCFDFKISLEKPYKLCDYKPYYGVIFEKHLDGYDFWGYCDNDLIFGDISRFLTDDMFAEYDKILKLGHLTFIRNTESIRYNYLKYDNYRTVLASPVSYAYDESIKGFRLGYNGELMESGYKVYLDRKDIADVEFREYPFRIVDQGNEKYIFHVKDNKTFKIIFKGEQLIETEVMYIHLQKRKMSIEGKIDYSNYYIIPNKFISGDSLSMLNRNKFDELTSNVENYFDFDKEKRQLILRDIHRFIREPKKISSIIFRLKKIMPRVRG